MPIVPALIERLRDQWIDRDGSIGVDEDAIIRVEHHLGIRMPETLREFYRAFGGLGAPSSEGPYNFWLHGTLLAFYYLDHCYLLSDRERADNPFGDDPEHPLDDPQHFIVFADCMIGSHFYAVRCVAGDRDSAVGEVVMVAPGVVSRIAPTFEDFLRRCLDDRRSIHVC